MDKGCSGTNISPQRWNDEDTFHISSLFLGADPDLNKLDLDETDEFPVPSRYQVMQALSPVREAEPDASPSTDNFDPMQFLNSEEEMDVDPQHKGEISNDLSLSSEAHDGLPTQPDDPGADEQRFHYLRSIVTTLPAKLEITGGHVAVQYSTSNKRAGGKHVKVSLPSNHRVPSTKGTVQCPQCQSLDTEPCSYKNGKPYKAKRRCKSCEKLWINSAPRRRYPKSTRAARSGIESGETSLVDAGKLRLRGPEEYEATAEGTGPPSTNGGQGPAEPGSRSSNHPNELPVSMESVPSPVNAVALGFQTFFPQDFHRALGNAQLVCDYSQFEFNRSR